MDEIKGRCKDCCYATKAGEYRFTCPHRGGSHLVRPEGYCDEFRSKEGERKA